MHQLITSFSNINNQYKHMNSNKMPLESSVKPTDLHLESPTKKRYPSHNPQFGHLGIRSHIPTTLMSDQKSSGNGCLSAETFREKVLYLLDYFFKDSETNLAQKVNNFLESDWQLIKVKVSNRLNKISYSEASLRFKPFGQIEKEILQEWKKNHLLYGIQILFNCVLRSHPFASLEELLKFYESFRSFVSQAVYLKFQNCLACLQVKNYPVLGKLYSETAVCIITGAKQWAAIYDQKLHGFISKKQGSSPQAFNILDLQISHRILHVFDEREQFTKTRDSLKDFAKQHKLKEKIRLLKEYRRNLLAQVQANIEANSSQEERNQHLTVEKQDILTCIIYVLVKYEVKNISDALLQLKFLLGSQWQELMSTWQCDSYRADLQAAIQYMQLETPECSKQSSSKKTIDTQDSSRKCIDF